jgi:predicted metal-binding membrane protein
MDPCAPKAPQCSLDRAWLLVLGSISVIAWSLVAFDGTKFMLPAFCYTRTLPAIPLSASFKLALTLNPPAKLASSVAFMVVAMMSPLLIAPLQHVRDCSFASRRARATLLCVAGYMAVWMMAGAGLQTIALAVQSAMPAPRFCLCLAAATAALWQVTPIKQWCLNRCHRRPILAPFGAAADRDAFVFGLTGGASCAGACWALMLVPFFVMHEHLLWMIAVTVFLGAERLHRPTAPGWRCPVEQLGVTTPPPQAANRAVPSSDGALRRIARVVPGAQRVPILARRPPARRDLM